jgi:hypothetical protein
MDTLNIGQFASVGDLPYTNKVITFKRGYGGTTVLTETGEGKINTTSTPYNRLQPLVGPFGKHEPATADPSFVALNPQTNLAWAVALEK